MFFVYILRSEVDGGYYIGAAKDVSERIAQHNAGVSLSTRSRRPWKLAYTEAYETLSQARRREQQIKSWKNPAYMVKKLGFGG